MVSNLFLEIRYNIIIGYRYFFNVCGVFCLKFFFLVLFFVVINIYYLCVNLKGLYFVVVFIFCILEICYYNYVSLLFKENS